MTVPRKAALVLGMALGLGAGCHAGGTTRATVVDLWAMGREGEVVRQMVPAFEAQNPGVRVRVQQIPWSAAHEKLLTAYVGDSMPDIVQVGNTWIPELVALGALQPLDERLRACACTSDYFPGILDTNVIDGSTYGVPWYVDTRLLFYRSDILEQAGYARPPATWTAWLDASMRITAQAGPGHYAIFLPFGEWQPLVILALQRGATLLRDHDQFGDFRSPPFRQAFEFYLDLFRRHLAPVGGAAQVANLYQDFGNGTFAFFISGPWNIGELTQRLPLALHDKWMTAPMPGWDDGTPGVSVAGGASLSLVRGSKNAAAAWKLIAYLAEPSQQLQLYRLTGDLPSRKTAWEDESVARNPYAAAFRQQLQHLRSTPKIPEWEGIAAKIGEYAEATIRDAMRPEEALARLDRDVDALLEKRRWMLRRTPGAATPPPGAG